MTRSGGLEGLRNAGEGVLIGVHPGEQSLDGFPEIVEDVGPGLEQQRDHHPCSECREEDEWQEES